MGFETRISMATKFELEVEQYCRRVSVMAAKNGTEHTHPDFVNNIRTNNAETAKLIRYAPDGILLTNEQDVYHWEAKCSDKIEKDAYKTYIKYTQIGHRVLLFCKSRGIVYCNFVENIALVDGAETVKKYPQSMRHPVKNKWIYPRLGHGNSGTGSGTPYREIELSSLKIIKNFYAD